MQPAQGQVTEITSQDLLNLIGTNDAAQVFVTSALDPTTTPDLQAALDATGANATYDLRALLYDLQGQGIIRYRTIAEAQALGWLGANDSYFSQAPHAFALILEDPSGQASGTVYSYHDIKTSGPDAGDNSYGGVFVTSSGQFSNPFDPPLLQYKTPLRYSPSPTTWSDETNGGAVAISGEVEGYGTIRTPAGTYEVMRVRRVNGTVFPTTDYEFISPSLGFTVATLEGQGDGTYVVSFVAASDDFFEAPVAAGATGPMASDNRVSVTFTAGSSAGGTLAIATYNQPPYNRTFATQTATSGDGTSIQPDVLWDDQYYTILNVGDQLSGFQAAVCFDASGVPGVADIQKLVLLTRTFASESWQPLNTTVDGSDLCASVSSFSQFAIGSSTQYNTLPVELSSFTAEADGQEAVLSWQTASETNNAGFAVQRKTPSGTFEQVAFVEGAGTTTAPQTYRFRTEALTAGTHTFRLRQVDTDGTASFSDPVTVQIGLRGAFTLTAYPNPVRRQATVEFAVKQKGEVTVTLYNTLGQKVRTVYRGTPPAEQTQRVQVETGGLASGLYLLRMTGNGVATTQRLTVVQ